MANLFDAKAVRLLRGRALQPVADASEAMAETKYILVYFSAHWCPPCRAFTPVLRQFYERHSAEKEFEVIFISRDNSEGEMRSYMESSHGDWLAMSYDSAKSVGSHWASMYGLRYIPSMLVFENAFNGSGEGKLITTVGKDMVMLDPDAERFPWVDGEAEVKVYNRRLAIKVIVVAFLTVSLVFYIVFLGL